MDMYTPLHTSFKRTHNQDNYVNPATGRRVHMSIRTTTTTTTTTERSVPLCIHPPTLNGSAQSESLSAIAFLNERRLSESSVIGELLVGSSAAERRDGPVDPDVSREWDGGRL